MNAPRSWPAPRANYRIASVSTAFSWAAAGARPLRADPRRERLDRRVDGGVELIDVVEDRAEVGQRLERERAAALAARGPDDHVGVCPGSRRPVRRPRPATAPGVAGHASPSRARSLLGSRTIDETPCSAHSSITRRSRTVLPEPEPAKIARWRRRDARSRVARPAVRPAREADADGRAAGSRGRRRSRAGRARAAGPGCACSVPRPAAAAGADGPRPAGRPGRPRRGRG